MQSINLDFFLIVDCDSMVVGYSGYAGSMYDEEEGTKDRFLKYTKQDVIRSGSLEADAYFMRATGEE